MPLPSNIAAYQAVSRKSHGNGDDGFVKGLVFGMIFFFLCLFSVFGFLFWTLDVSHRESKKVEIIIESFELNHYKSKHHNYYAWDVDVKATTGESHQVRLRETYKDKMRGDADSPKFTTDVPFKTLMVIHSTRSGRQDFYFPDIQKDAPKIP